MTFEEFMEKYCYLCGTQRCIPTDEFWREGCPYFQKEKLNIIWEEKDKSAT